MRLNPHGILGEWLRRGVERALMRRQDTDPDVVYIARCPTHGLHGERTECFVCGGPVERVAMVPVSRQPEREPMAIPLEDGSYASCMPASERTKGVHMVERYESPTHVCYSCSCGKGMQTHKDFPEGEEKVIRLMQLHGCLPQGD